MSKLDLQYRIFELLLEQNPGDPVCDLALAALSGDDELNAAIDGSPPNRPTPPAPKVTPVGAYLSSISVEGFRGIGPRTTIRFAPGPGLTIIAGRNGSGKSSLAEGLEYALTHTTYRWRQGTRFTERWRNLHQPEPSQIAVELAQENVGRSTITVKWPAGTEAEDAGEVHFQPHGKPRSVGLGSLGWDSALDTYRPMLSYEELGGLLRERRSSLHDKIKVMLGLEILADADGRLKTRLDPLKQPAVVASRDRVALRKRAEDIEDDRARQAVVLLKRTKPDLGALRSLATGNRDGSSRAQVLREIAALELPGVDEVAAAAHRLSEAIGAEADIAQQTAALADQRRDLLQQALQYAAHAEEDVPCPVCGEGTLDAGWRSRTATVLQDSDLLDAQRRAVRTALEQARRTASALIIPPPGILAQQDFALGTQAAAARAWMSWSARPEGDSALVQHLQNAFRPLVGSIEAWQADASAASAELDETWQPLAVAIGAWTERYEQAQRDETLRLRLESTRSCLLTAEKVLRKERMAPIVDHAREIWGRLRQESNVDLGDIDLIGTATHRDVSISAAVDGADAGALSVMSQGELHALALALFLPRAALPESPFQFIVLDDPVQAMDPSKVDGLAQVLSDLADTHQVIVLTHDDRLAQAGRRLTKPPAILEVTRNTGSQVIVHESSSPTRRYLEDADALRKDSNLPEPTCRAVIPGVLRQALEAACHQRFFSDQLRRGSRIIDVEHAWNAASTTRLKMQLAVGQQELERWLQRTTERQRALAICTRGGHASLLGDIGEAVTDVRRTVGDIERHVR